MDVGGLDFMYPPVGLRTMKGHGYPVDLDGPAGGAARISTDPHAPRSDRQRAAVGLPPGVAGAYYQVWARRPGAPAAIDHLGLSGTARPMLERPAIGSGRRVSRCATGRGDATRDGDGRRGRLAHTPTGRTPTRPRNDGRGSDDNGVPLPYAGLWKIWLKGQFMPTFSVSVDGHAIASIGGEIDGNPHNPGTAAPLRVTLSAGRHRLTIARGGVYLTPGEGGWAIVHEVFLTPPTPLTRTRCTSPRPLNGGRCAAGGSIGSRSPG